MTLQVQLQGQLQAGPASISDSQFPSGVDQINFNLNPPQKQYVVSTGIAQIQVSSPAPGFQTISAIGASGSVTQATTFYARCQTPMIVQITQADINGGADRISNVEVSGVFVLETPSNGYIKALAVQGSGQFEFWASGSL